MDDIKGKLKKAARLEAKSGKPCTFDDIVGKECAKYTKLPIVWALAEGTKDGKPASVAIGFSNRLPSTTRSLLEALLSKISRKTDGPCPSVFVFRGQ